MNLLSENELAALAERIANTRVLREHHVWEAVRCLSIDVRDHRSDGPWQFVELMEADALLDAVVHRTTLSEQKCSVTSIGNAGERWIAPSSACRPSAGRPERSGRNIPTCLPDPRSVHPVAASTSTRLRTLRSRPVA